VLPGLFGEDVFACCLEAFWDWGGGLVHEVADSEGHLLFLLGCLSFGPVLLLEGLTVDSGELSCCCCWVTRSEDELWLLEDEVAQVLVVRLCFFGVVGDWEETEPVLNELGRNLWVAVDVALSKLEDFANACNSIVPCVVVLGHLHLLGLDLGCHGEVNRRFQRGKAKVSAGSECFTTMFGNDSNTVCGGLSQAGTLTSTEAADRLHDGVEVFCAEVCWSKVFDHIIKDEDGELQTLLLVACEG